MEHLSLDGDWQLFYFPESEYHLEHPDDLDSLGLPPIPGRVPGNVELDLHRAGRIPEPFYANNIHSLRPYELYQWWYTTEFNLPDAAAHARWDLVFGGLDTIATVWVNGIEVGQSANMLIEQRFDVTSALRWGASNRIAVRLRSPILYARRFRYEAADASDEHREEGLFIRKAPHMWGWDIAPRAVSAGIWRPVWLELHHPTAIEQMYYWTISIDSEGATLGVRYQFRTDATMLDGLVMRFHGVCEDSSFELEWPVDFVAGGCRIKVPNAHLWWPKGYGEPHLYTTTAQLRHGERILAERVERIGIRKLVVDRTERPVPAWEPPSGVSGVAQTDALPDRDSHFLFYVNDVPIMIKGANWVPLDAFHSRDAERVEQVVALFEDLGCNMIRCWGGNVYEDHRFFDLCDEKGILVWQDFAFACCRYPQTESFLDEIRREAQAVVEKLRNHPSLAVWCGDNEVDMNTLRDGLSPDHNRLTREIIPQVVYRCDPYRHYIPSSPYIPSHIQPESGTAADAPEQHLWGPRGYFKSQYYTQHRGHFISEIGYHGCPNVSSLRRFLSPERLWPWQDNVEWQVHSGYHWHHRSIDRDRVRLLTNQICEFFGFVPEDLESFALASQIAQAEAFKFFVESTRLRKWRTSGILWWNVMDGWPQFSEAVVDYFFGKKLAYHYIWRSQRPVCILVGEPGQDQYLPVVVCNDTRSWAQGTYRVWDGEQGDTMLAGTFAVPPNQNWQVGRIRAFASDQRLYLIEWELAGQVFGNHYLAGSPPFSLDRYRRWLKAIAVLHRPFDAEQVAV